MNTDSNFYYRPSGWDTAIYPMPTFARLACSDVARASRWYQDVLGFAHVFSMPSRSGGIVLAHLRWCAYGDLLLAATPAEVRGTRGIGVDLTFAAPELGPIIDHAATHHVSPTRGPTDQPWNIREVTFTDPDGFQITFASPTESAAQRILRGNPERFDDLLKRMKSGDET